jgi:hypothetical protein
VTCNACCESWAKFREQNRQLHAPLLQPEARDVKPLPWTIVKQQQQQQEQQKSANINLPDQEPH